MVQPVVVTRLVSDTEMVGRGLLSRFLFSTPPSLVGRRRTGRHLPPIPEPVADAYQQRLHALAIDLAAWTDPARLAFTPEALDILDPYEATIEHRQAPGADLAATGPWAGKLVGNILRVAGLLHLADHGPTGLRHPIGPDPLHAAIAIGDYFIAHARTILAPRRTGLDNARTVLAYLRRHQLTGFSFAELHRALSRDRFPTKDTVQDAVDVLAEHGWIVELPAVKPAGPGRRPSPRYLVHTALGGKP
jgi:replicative DNA helicase